MAWARGGIVGEESDGESLRGSSEESLERCLEARLRRRGPFARARRGCRWGEIRVKFGREGEGGWEGGGGEGRGGDIGRVVGGGRGGSRGRGFGIECGEEVVVGKVAFADACSG